MMEVTVNGVFCGSSLIMRSLMWFLKGNTDLQYH